jgi:hypothetical protein
MTDFNQNLKGPIGRRGFINRMAAAGLGALAVNFLGGCTSSQDTTALSPGTPTGAAATTTTTGVTYFDAANFPGVPGKSENAVVLNFALTLELLEADLYRQALNLASGLPITTPLASSPSDYSQTISNGALSATLAPVGYLYLQQFAFVEAAHRDFLTAYISTFDTPVSANPGGYTAPFGTDLGSILTVIRTLEEEGVRAYLGAAGYLTSLDLVQVASTIYSTEARHASVVNLVLGLDAGPTFQNGDLLVTPSYPSQNTFEYYRTPSQVLNDVTPFLVS